MVRKRLVAVVRLRESVAETQAPQLVRGQNDSEEELTEDDYRRMAGLKPRKPVKPAKAKGAQKNKSGKKAKKAREGAARFVAQLREVNIDRSGSAYEATLLREGPGNPGDANAYSKEALRRAVVGGMFDGLQCYANHPTPTEERERPERDVRHLVGHFREARFVDGNPAEVRAKFVPIEGDGYGWVRSLIESALKAPADKPLIGISIDGYGVAPEQKDINGKMYKVVREITQLGSADIVTRAGAGGRFHRKLSESLAGARATASTGRTLDAGGLQKLIRTALKRLERGLDDEDDGRVQEAFVRLHEAASASLKVKSAKPADGSAGKLREAERQLSKERKRRRHAEERADLADRAKLAGRLLREVDIPAATRESWFEDLVAKQDEDAMRKLLDRKQAEHREQLGELRESLGLDRIEGNPRREPQHPTAPAGPSLLDRLGIDKDELEAA